MKAKTANPQEVRHALEQAGAINLLQGRVLLVFLRHPGCLFTSTTLAALGQKRAKIEALGVSIGLVHLDPEPDCAQRQVEKHGLVGVTMIADLERRIYRAAGMERGGLRAFMSWNVCKTGLLALFAGHRQSKIKADPRQLAGAAVLQDGAVLKSEACADAAEVPDFLALAQG